MGFLEFLPPLLWVHLFAHVLTNITQTQLPDAFLGGVVTNGFVVKENCRKTGDLEPLECGEHIVNIVSDAMSPWRKKSF